MDTRGIAAVLLKVTGLVLIVFSISQLPAYFPLTGRDYEFSMREVLATTALGLGPLVAAGLILWFFPGTLTNKIVSSASPDSAPTDSRPIELVALTILGVYLMAHGIIGAVRDIVFVIVSSRQTYDLAAVPASIIAHAAATGAELLMGLGLCIGAKGIARVIARLRQ